MNYINSLSVISESEAADYRSSPMGIESLAILFTNCEI
jgi:hypothetical protein